MKSTYYNRFKGLPWFNLISKSKIIVFGQGGIGSHLTFFLARTGATLVTVDYDTVEEVNIAGQLYGKSDIGRTKTSAMLEVVKRLCGETKITPLNEKVVLGQPSLWQSNLATCDVVCVSFDSIAARRIIFDAWKLAGKKGSLFVDGRMSIENGQVFTVEKDVEGDYKRYESSFFDDTEVAEAPCTMKATTHCGSIIASLMTSQITNWFNNKEGTTMPRTLAKQIDFNLPLVTFNEI